MARANREWVLKSRPGKGGFANSDFEIRPCPAEPPGDGDLLLRTHLISVDPTMRNAMAGEDAAERTAGSSYYTFMNWRPGQVITWSLIGRVEESRAPGFSKGDMVSTSAPLRELTVASAKTCKKIPAGVAPTAVMSVLGGTGQTGFMGAKFIGEPKKGEVAFVSGAAGATGLTACQTLKILGCRVIGSAGSDAKVAVLESVGVRAFNYKKESTLQALRRLAPEGVNIYFDNVGGETLEQAIEMMNDFGRVVLCGAISQYDTPPEQRYGVKNLFHAIAKQLRMQGFIVWAFTPEQQRECADTLAGWLRTGAMQDRHTAVDGFEKFPDGIRGLFTGANTGKMLVRVPLPPARL